MVTMMVAAIEHKTGFTAVLNDPSDKERAVFGPRSLVDPR